jgi:uncharacterized protein (DUF1810 family)
MRRPFPAERKAPCGPGLCSGTACKPESASLNRITALHPPNPMDHDPHDLRRFLDAQAPVYAQAIAQLTRGAKASHWMWFVFPQLKGLGRSGMAQHYGLASLDEARAYWRHPVLGARLADCVQRVMAVEGRSVHRIFGSPDDLKFGSSMTLFALAVPDEPAFQQAIDRHFGGVRDPATLSLLGA